MEQEVEIQNALGLHARAAAKVVDIAMNAACQVKICVSDKTADATSIIELLMLAAIKGTRVCIRTNEESEAAQETVQRIVDLIENKFDEDA